MRRGDSTESNQDSLACASLDAAGVAGVDYASRDEDVANFQSRIECAGESGGIDHFWRVESNNRLGRAARRLGADAAADYDRLALLKETESAAGVLFFECGPLAD